MKKPRDTTLALSTDYRQFVTDLKSRIANARLSAARHVNRELIALYWDIGQGIVEKQQALGWGESIVEMVAAELRAAFPDMTGFSARSVWEMERLYEAYSAPEVLSKAVRESAKRKARPILQQPVAELTHARAIRRQAVVKLGDSEIPPQAVAENGVPDPAQILRQLVAEIPWGHIHLAVKTAGRVEGQAADSQATGGHCALGDGGWEMIQLFTNAGVVARTGANCSPLRRRSPIGRPGSSSSSAP